jgi:glycosyltransferase involved in cell wall biosynthesis
VIPVRNEAENIPPLFVQLSNEIQTAREVLIVYDTEDDPTVEAVRRAMPSAPFDVRLIRNDLGRGPANAIRAGFNAAYGDAIVVVMADLSDELAVVDRMADEIHRGADLVAGSRYMRGGHQHGGPLLKRILSRLAGVSLYYIAGLPTHDATNAFKIYRANALRTLEIEGDGGFEISMEITVKAWLAGWRISELPATWTDRIAGDSKFRLWKWLPRYFRWYTLALRGRFTKIKELHAER